MYVHFFIYSVVHSRNSSIPSNCSAHTRTNTSDEASGQCSRASSRRPSRVNSRKNSHRKLSKNDGGDVASPEEVNVIKQFRVALLGASEVGKSALTSQFLSSDHMNTYDTVGKKYRLTVFGSGKYSKSIRCIHWLVRFFGKNIIHFPLQRMMFKRL